MVIIIMEYLHSFSISHFVEHSQNNKELLKREKLIKEQKLTIKEQKKTINEQYQENVQLTNIINILNNNIESLKKKFEKEVNKWKNLLRKVCKALDKILGIKTKENLEDYEDVANEIIYDSYDVEKKKGKKKDDYEIGI